ncbi:MAG: TadE family protein [Candidatus Dormibacteria bacterium]
MVEFALVAPLLFLFVTGIIVVAVVAGNQNLLSNGVRDSARAAAVCGGTARNAATQPSTQLPATGGQALQTCSWSALDSYVKARLTQLAGGNALQAPAPDTNCQKLPSGVATVCLYTSSNTPATYSGNPLDSCQLGYRVGISSQYVQPLFVPLLNVALGGGSSSLTLKANSVATCEQ